MASLNVSYCPSTTTRAALSGSQNFKLFNGLHGVNSFSVNGNAFNLAAIRLDGSKSSFDIKGGSKTRATLISGDELLSYSNGNGVVASITNDFAIFNDNRQLDHPSEGFSSIPDAIEDIRQGKIVVVVDDEDRENEGDLIMAAELATPEAMAFLVKHGTGIVCVSMKGEDLDRLQLPLMVSQNENDEKLRTAFTVTVDAKHGTTTGVSANDRATTVLALASKDSKPDAFNRPGHIFPLRYREGGVLKRAGHTEASVDLAVLAGLDPVAVLCEVVDDDGSMARLPKLRQFAERENLKIISIADLIKYRRKTDKLVEYASAAQIPTMWGPFTAHCYRSILDGIEHIAMVKGAIGDGEDVLVRVHSECLTGDIFGSARCDCGNQLALAMQQIEAAGRGVLIYLRGHEGRGIGLGHKLRAYNLQDDGRDTVEANEELGLPVDSREYGIGAQGAIGDGEDVLVRVHSECLTGDIFGSARCDCGNQLALAMQQIEAAGRGVLIYLRGHEGRGIGLGHKLRAYNLQDDGRDTVEANEELGLPVDSREYGIGAQMLRDLGVQTMKLMTNNPAKYIGLKGYGLAVTGRVPLLTPITEDNKRYLETKSAKMGHIYDAEFIRHLSSNLVDSNGGGKSSADVVSS